MTINHGDLNIILYLAAIAGMIIACLGLANTWAVLQENSARRRFTTMQARLKTEHGWVAIFIGMAIVVFVVVFTLICQSFNGG